MPMGATSVEFLGHIVGQGQVKPSVCKEAGLKHFVQPTTKRQLKRFLDSPGTTADLFHNCILLLKMYYLMLPF